MNGKYPAKKAMSLLVDIDSGAPLEALGCAMGSVPRRPQIHFTKWKNLIPWSQYEEYVTLWLYVLKAAKLFKIRTKWNVTKL